MVAFLLGCSFTFEHALLSNNIPIRHIDCNTLVSKTNIHVGKQEYLKAVNSKHASNYYKRRGSACFGACGVKPETVAMEVKPKLMITHKASHMLCNEQLGSLIHSFFWKIQ
ncbi:D-glutamate cyclase family protein [Peribacillus sp. NPDC096540]|uniref:D-glutamate cyclase family protein n=1 Tax=Peribacillus sp. NPDC096540 TaxID=3390612 RepID=UPI003CFFF1B4